MALNLQFQRVNCMSIIYQYKTIFKKQITKKKANCQFFHGDFPQSLSLPSPHSIPFPAPPPPRPHSPHPQFLSSCPTKSQGAPPDLWRLRAAAVGALPSALMSPPLLPCGNGPLRRIFLRASVGQF